MTVPIGGIIWWSGAAGAVPAGYQICDGSLGTPDLRDKFVPCAGGAKYVPGATGGSDQFTVAAHGHGLGTVAAIADNLHSHDVVGYVSGDNVPADTVIGKGNVSVGCALLPGIHEHTFTIPSMLPALPLHSHTLSGVYAAAGPISAAFLPEWYALYFIQRLV